MNLLYQKNIYFIDIMSSWLGNTNANRFKQIYLQGFLDISGGDLTLRNGGVSVNGNTTMYSTLNNYSYDNNNFNNNICKVWNDSLLRSTPNIFQSISISANGQYQAAITKNNQTQKGGNIYISNNYGLSNSWRDTNIVTINMNDNLSLFNQISISKTGQYITAVSRQIRPADTGNIYLSNDYGSSWSIKNPVSPGYMQSVSLSYTGQYQTIVTYGFNNDTTTDGYIYTSNDYGNSWTNQLTRRQGFQSVAISATGQYQVTVQSGTSSNAFGNIYYSNNYGNEWIDSQYQINNYNRSVTTTVLYMYELSQTIAISYDGKYQTVLNIQNGGNIIINNNYGSGIWTDTNQRSSYGNNGLLVSVAMSSTGQYQIVGTYNTEEVANDRTGKFSSILLSCNYGLPGSWTTIQNNTILQTIGYNTNTFHSLAISANANYISGVAKYYNESSISPIYGNLYTSSLYSSLNNNISLQYFGSNNRGNISSNHPFAISLPNSFNNGLYMGYDLATDGAYINSLNLYGSKNLSLQTQGGFLGVGNLFPKYTLDVSGNFNVSGTTYLQSTICNSLTIGSSTQNYYTSLSSVNLNYTGSNVSRGFVINSDNIILNSSKTIMDSSNIILQPYSGNVSIGKSTPQYKLDVSGTVNISNNNSNLPSLIVTSANNGPGLQLYGSGSGIHLDTSANRPFSNPATQILAVDVSGNTNDLVFRTANFSNSSFVQNTERMRITNKGQIGIGTSTPGVPIYPIINANDLSNCKLDISGSMRIYESVGSGGTDRSTIGSLVLQHGNADGASSILFTGSPVNTDDPSGNDYGSITYYDNVAKYTGFPNYFGYQSSYNESSALVLDVGNNKGMTRFGYDNLILKSTGCTIVDTGLITYFVNGVSIGKIDSETARKYVLDVSGSVNTNNINVVGNITISNGISVSAGNINASNTNLFINKITAKDLITAQNGITANTLTVSRTISGNTLSMSGNIDCSGTINANVISVTGRLDLFSGLNVNGNLDAKGNLNVGKKLIVTDTTDANPDNGPKQGSIVTHGGIYCTESLYIENGQNIYIPNGIIGQEDNGNRVQNIYTEGITIYSPGFSSANRGFQLTGDKIQGISGSTTIQATTIIAESILRVNGNIDCIPRSDTGGTTGWINANGGLKIAQGKRLDCSGGITTYNFTVDNEFISNCTINAVNDISAGGTVYINNLEDSNANKTGALIVRGGIYCDKQFYGNGFITAKSGISLPSNSRLDVSGSITSSGGINLTSTSNLTANALIQANNGITASHITVDVNDGSSSSNYGIHIQNATSSSSSTTGALRVRGGAGIIGNCYVGGIIDACGNITINNKNSLILKDNSNQSTINQVNGNLKITNNAINGNTIFYNKNLSGVNTEILQLNYDKVTSQKDLYVNGSIYINGTLLSSNNFTDWNSNLLNVSRPTTANNYYLIASMADFSNNTNLGGGLTIKGSIGGGSASNTMIIDTTVITRGNSINPTINGTIQKYSLANSNLCDIVIYYTGTITNSGSSNYGSASGAQYYIYLVTNKNSGTRNIYFNLNITGNESNSNNIFLYNPSSIITTSPSGQIVIKSLTSVLSNIDDVFTTTYTESIITRNNIVAGTNTSFDSSTTSDITFRMNSSSNNSYLYVSSDFIYPNATYEVSITCRTNSNGIDSELFFILESSGNTTELYKSPKISRNLTTYLGNVVISSSTFINIHLYINSSTTSGVTITISNITVKRIDTYNTGFLGIGTTAPLYNLDVSGTTRTASACIGTQPLNSNDVFSIANNTNIFYFNKQSETGVYNTNTRTYSNWQLTSNGKLYLNEATGSVGDQTSGTITLEHKNSGGTSSIVFRSATNLGSDYGYIRYKDDVENVTTNERARLEIGLENDYGSDFLILQKNGGNVGIGTTNPAYILDVNGSIIASNWFRIRGNEGIYWESWGGGWHMYDSTWIRTFNNKNIYTDGSIYCGGNLGIGTTSPTAKLDVISNYGVSSSVTLSVGDSTSGNRMFFLPNLTGGNYNPCVVNGDQTIISTGTVDAETLTLTTHSNTNSGIRISPTSVSMGAGGGGTTATTSIVCNRTSITMTGNVGIGTNDPSYNLDVIGTTRSTDVRVGRKNVVNLYAGMFYNSIEYPGFVSFHTGSGINTTDRAGYIGWRGTNNTNYVALNVENGFLGYECNGTIRAAAFNAVSDYRMKQNVRSLSVNKTIDNLKPVEYDLSGGTHDMGFLAHEVQEEYPFLVQGEKDGDSMQSLNYNGFIALLVKEVQELKTNFKKAVNENEGLRETLKSLQSRIEILENK